jgi:hypothetical protein
MDTVLDLIRKQEQDYNTGTTKISEHVEFSVKDNVDKIDAYLNSKHISGEKDSLGREKPFFNIVTAAVNVWYRATDIDRANIRIKSTKSSSHTAAMLANIKSKEWMRKAQFGVFLNEWGRTLSRYGSAVCKFVEQDGKLVATVVPWNRLIIDAIDFENNPVIEKHFYTPAQLRKNKLFDQEQVEALILQAQASRELSGGEKVDTKADYLEIYELHGELPLSYITQKESDEDTYTQQVHICSFETDENGDYLDYTLYAGREKNPYMITHLIKEDGRAMAIGAVEHLFEAQWMVNHNEKAIKDQLDLASKLIFQSSDPAYQGKNTGNLDTGSILTHEPNQPLTRLETTPDITASLNSKQNWVNNANEQVSTPDAMKGNTMPSGTAARQVEALQQEGHSLFELMTENKGLAIEDMWRRFVIPHVKKDLDTQEEIVAVLDDAGVQQIDAIYLPNEAKRRENERIKKQMFDLAKSDITEDVEFPQPADIEGATAQVTEELKTLGNQRYFSPDGVTWKEVFKNFEWDVEVEVTNEQNDKLSTLTTLTTVLKELAGMGDAENARIVLNKILEETGVFSPMELRTAQATPMPVEAPQPPA